VKIRCSNTLADDEGVVFATKVPGSPIQVMGRRDPRTGSAPAAIVRARNTDWRGKRVMTGRGQREGVAAEFLRDVLAGGPLGVPRTPMRKLLIQKKNRPMCEHVAFLPVGSTGSRALSTVVGQPKLRVIYEGGA
jgi:hypothetical protein